MLRVVRPTEEVLDEKFVLSSGKLLTSEFAPDFTSLYVEIESRSKISPPFSHSTSSVTEQNF